MSKAYAIVAIGMRGGQSRQMDPQSDPPEHFSCWCNYIILPESLVAL